MRLIDADEFIRWIDLGHLRHPSELCFSELDVVNMINHQPTAYNVGAVLSELEKNYELTIDNYKMTADMYFSGKAFAFDVSIEAVKRGGIND